MNKKAAKALARVQISMWVDGKTKCLHCNHIYESVDDFIERNPRAVSMKDMLIVDEACWGKYELNTSEGVLRR